jgi:hypothetical protein
MVINTGIFWVLNSRGHRAQSTGQRAWGRGQRAMGLRDCGPVPTLFGVKPAMTVVFDRSVYTRKTQVWAEKQSVVDLALQTLRKLSNLGL